MSANFQADIGTLTVETTLGATYSFPDVVLENAQSMVAVLKTVTNLDLHVANMSTAFLTIPRRIIKTIKWNEECLWTR